jgi:hypothetical protein
MVLTRDGTLVRFHCETSRVRMEFQDGSGCRRCSIEDVKASERINRFAA